MVTTTVGVQHLLILLPVLLPIHDVISGGLAVELGHGVAWSGCPGSTSAAVSDNVSDITPRCECTTFDEIHCHNLPTVPPFPQSPSFTWRGVYMPGQNIGDLPAGAFGKLRTAKLVLNFNRLGDRVQAGALDGQGTSLAELQLAGCEITSLPARLLAGMDTLTRLHLWGNRLTEFPVRFFREAANLRELMLWNNELSVLDSDTLAGLWNLRRLDLDRNFIVKLDKNAFRNLIELRTLHIPYNRIQVAACYVSVLNSIILKYMNKKTV